MAITKDSYKGVNYCIRCGNKVEIFEDREGKLRPQCKNCGWTFYKNPIPVAACLIVNDKNEIVVIKRKYEPHPDKWALPSGYIEIDQTPEENAIEEMKEETGLDGEIIKFMGYFPGHSPIYERVISFGFLMRPVGGQLQAGDDASEAHYVSLDELPPICFDSHRRIIEQFRQSLAQK